MIVSTKKTRGAKAPRFLLYSEKLEKGTWKGGKGREEDENVKPHQLFFTGSTFFIKL